MEPQYAVNAVCEVAIVGGGLGGLACARFLADEGVNVVVIDDGAPPGDIGAAWLTHGEHPWRITASLGDDRAGELYRFGREGLALAARMLPFERSGGMWIAGDAREEDEIGRSIDALRAADMPVDEVDHGMRLPDEGIVDPCAARAALLGAIEVHRSRVRSVDTDSSGVIVVTERGTVRCDAVVLAAGAGLRKIDGIFEEMIFPYRDQLRICADVEAQPSDRLVRTGLGWTAYVRHGGRVAVTGARWATPHLEEGESEPVVVDAVQQKLDAFVASRLPAVAHQPVLERRAVIHTKSCDGLPLIGPLPGRPRFIACAGFHGNPVSWGLRAGRAVADGLLRGRSEGVPEFLAMTRMV
jgi:glycine/D-amino acid oxidase-like deaminating enzyme